MKWEFVIILSCDDILTKNYENQGFFGTAINYFSDFLNQEKKQSINITNRLFEYILQSDEISKARLSSS